MKYAITLGLSLFACSVIAGEGWHNFTDQDNPHAKGSCASKDKMAQFHKYHGKDWQHDESAEKKVEQSDKKEKPALDQYI